MKKNFFTAGFVLLTLLAPVSISGCNDSPDQETSAEEEYITRDVVYPDKDVQLKVLTKEKEVR